MPDSGPDLDDNEQEAIYTPLGSRMAAVPTTEAEAADAMRASRRFTNPPAIATTVAAATDKLLRHWTPVGFMAQQFPMANDEVGGELAVKSIPALLTALYYWSVTELIQAVRVQGWGELSVAELEVRSPRTYDILMGLWSATNAVPYYLSVDVAEEFLSAIPATGEDALLRLPFREVMVLFGAPLQIDIDSGWWTPELPLALRARWGRVLAEALRHPGQLGDGSDDLIAYQSEYAFFDHGGYLHGIILRSDDEGRLTDDVTWLGSMQHMDAAGDTGLIDLPINASVARSALKPLIANAAAAVCWGKWIKPESSKSELGSISPRQMEKLMATGGGRRRIKRGALMGVHVIDVVALDRERPLPEPNVTGEGTGRSVRAHERRAHRQRFRIVDIPKGPGNPGIQGQEHIDWHYEVRHIPKLKVRGTAAPGDEMVMRVYRVPTRSLLESQPPMDDGGE